MAEIGGSLFGKQTLRVWGIGDVNRKSVGGTVSGFVGSLVLCVWVVDSAWSAAAWLALAVIISVSNTLARAVLAARHGRLLHGDGQCPDLPRFWDDDAVMRSQSRLSRLRVSGTTRREFMRTSAALAAAAFATTPSAVASAGVEIIDCHTHFYDPGRPQGVPWPGKSETALYRPVYPRDYRALAAPLGITGTVVVEASAWPADNDWILDLARL